MEIEKSQYIIPPIVNPTNSPSIEIENNSIDNKVTKTQIPNQVINKLEYLNYELDTYSHLKYKNVKQTNKIIGTIIDKYVG